jgi:hypothetical protein
MFVHKIGQVRTGYIAGAGKPRSQVTTQHADFGATRNPFQGTVARDFLLDFFHGSSLYGAQISTKKDLFFLVFAKLF